MDRIVALYPWAVTTVQGVLGPYTRLWEAFQDSMKATVVAWNSFPGWAKKEVVAETVAVKK